MIRLAVLIAALVALPLIAAAKDAITMKTVILKVDAGPVLPLSRLDLPAANDGFAGAAVGLADNNTTGRFLGQSFEAVEVTAKPGDAISAAEAAVADGVGGIIALAPQATLLALADHFADQNIVILNAGARDDVLRNAECRANVLHVAPSRAMLADALAQYMVWKKWDEWLLIHGSHPADQLKADAYRRAAKKFGLKIVEERLFEDTGGARRTDSGHVLVQRQIPKFTSRAEDHDVVVAADETGVFGDYLAYRTTDPRPVVGDAGLVARSWHSSFEGWGATQIQRRFEKANQRRMTDNDYNAWLAMRVIGEAVSRTKSADPAVLKDFILSDDFEVAGFKGQALSFRPWNNQLRQGVLLADGKLVVTVSPQEEFLHQKTRLDTLGFDEPETECAF